MSFVRPGLVAAGVGAAVWFSFGALGVTGFSPTSRLGLLPPFWAIAPAVLLAAALLVWPFRAGRESLVRAQPALLFSIFLFLPWLPIVVPAPFLLWLGPMAALVWIGVAVSALALARPHWPGALARLLTDGARAPWVAGALALVVYSGAVFQMSARVPGGDEPHYLIIADSLLRDGDLQIENNHRERQYLAYIDGELKPDYLRRGDNGQIYSIHAPGLSALVLPAFALGGYRGASLFLALLSAIGAGLLWRAGWRLTGDSAAAWIGWAVAAFSAPFLFHAFTMYPDGAAAVFLLIGVSALVRAADLSSARLVLHGAALAFLPWLHTRYALLAGMLGLAMALRLARGPDRARRIALFFATPIVSAIGWFTFFYVIYGTPNPAAPYGSYTQASLGSVPGGLMGLLFDQQFGLLLTAPALVISFAGLFWLGARRERISIELLCIVAPYAAATAAYHMWWGGWSAPARFLAPIVLTLGLPAALAWSRLRTRTSRATAISALVVGLALSATMLLVREGRFIYNDRDGFALWTDWASPVADVAYGLPSFFRQPRATFWAQIGVWAGLLGVTWTMLGLWERHLERVARTTRDKSLEQAWQRTAPIYGAVVVPLALASASMFAFAFCWTLAAVPGLRPDVAQVDLLHQLRDGIRPVVFDYAPIGRERTFGLLQLPRIASIEEATARLGLTTAARRTPRPAPPFLAFHVPAGRYRLEPSVTGRLAGRLDVLVGRSPVPIASYDLAALADSYTGGRLALPLDLPVDAGVLTVRADEAASASVRQARLYPTALLPPRSEDVFPGLEAFQGAKYHDVQLFAMTRHAYVEPGGWWVKPGGASEFLLVRERNGTTWPLVLRNGPRPNRITLEAEKWSRELSMGAGEEVTLDVPASTPRTGRQLGLVVTAETGFRPSAVSPGSADHRLLGVWIGVRESAR